MPPTRRRFFIDYPMKLLFSSLFPNNKTREVTRAVRFRSRRNLGFFDVRLKSLPVPPPIRYFDKSGLGLCPEEQTAEVETEDPSQVLGKCSREKMGQSARLGSLRSATFLAAQHFMFGNVCLCLYVPIPGSHVTIQLQFSSHFATRIGR